MSAAGPPQGTRPLGGAARSDARGEHTSPSGTEAALSLAALLHHPAIWRGGDCASEPMAVPSGFPALDAALPGRGWPGAALTEVLLAREGIGEIRLTLPALVCLQQQRRDVVWIAPPHRPYAPALVGAGLDPARFYIVRCATPQETLWAYEQALRAPECGAAFAWLPTRDDRVLRRLQVAAREGRTWGVLWRRPGHHAVAAAAPLRLALTPQEGRLAVRVLKRRGGELAQPVLIDVNARPVAAPRLDPRTSAAGPPQGTRPLGGAARSAVRGDHTSAGFVQLVPAPPQLARAAH